MHALLYRRHLPRYLLSRAAYAVNRSWWRASLAPLSAARLELPVPARPGWVRLRVRLAGICGTDLNVLTGSESLYLEPEATYPFVPGHEIVGEVEEAVEDESTNGLREGDRVAVWPILGCAARGLQPCSQCAGGWDGLCTRRHEGWPESALSIGFNTETGGGWSEACLAHGSQIWKLPDTIADEDAVFLDPAASALAALLRTEEPVSERTLVIGGGTIGLLCAYLHRRLGLSGDCDLIVRHDFQRRWANEYDLSAVVLPTDEAFRDWSSAEGIRTVRIQGYGRIFHGTYDRVIVAAASTSATEWALGTVRPGGMIALLTSPAALRGFDPTPLWYREITLRGIYVYGPVFWNGGRQHAYKVLMDALLDGRVSFRSLLTHEFDLPDFRDAIRTALDHSGTESIKVAFRPNGDSA